MLLPSLRMNCTRFGRDACGYLADAGLSPKTVEFLRQIGHEATHVRDLGLQRARDSELVERARVDASVTVTFNLDFGDLLALGASVSLRC